MRDTYKGFDADELREIFTRISNPDDWRAPISVQVRGEDVPSVVAAIEFMTATEPLIKLDVERMRYLITSEGYRLGPAGP